MTFLDSLNRLSRPLAAFALALGICSCQTIDYLELPPGAEESQVVVTDAAPPEEVPAEKTADRAVESTTPCLPVEPLPYAGDPIPMVNVPQWSPPGIAGPWPHDEYLEDGGDTAVPVNLGTDGGVHGLELEDTVAIYDTLDGETKIKPSNRVCLYAPRFAAVRQVTTPLENLQRDKLTAVSNPVLPQLNQEDRLATTAVQPVQPEGEISTRHSSIERTQETATPAISQLPVLGVEGGFATYENLLIIRKGTFEESEQARLQESIDAAITWTHDQAVQVVLDGRPAVDFTGNQKAQATFRVDEPNHPCLRVIKIASEKVAKPGDIIDFTIRFDNTGDQTIQHVELIDNLTTRLEYVPQTAQSSLRSEFSTEVNDGDSLVLRWDFVDPLPPGKGGLVRFNCRVR